MLDTAITRVCDCLLQQPADQEENSVLIEAARAALECDNRCAGVEIWVGGRRLVSLTKQTTQMPEIDLGRILDRLWRWVVSPRWSSARGKCK
jgi:hypothetical protein